MGCQAVTGTDLHQDDTLAVLPSKFTWPIEVICARLGHPLDSQERRFQGRMVTTHWILSEVADAFAGSFARQAIKALVTELEDDPSVLLLEASAELFQRGLELYHERPDKHWSLTDCISFVVMTDQGLSEALTGDHHFAQAGFHPVFG